METMQRWRYIWSAFLQEYVRRWLPILTILNILFWYGKFWRWPKMRALCQHRQRKIRMRIYIENPQADSPAFLWGEVKDEEWIAIICPVATSASHISTWWQMGSRSRMYDPISKRFRLRKRYIIGWNHGCVRLLRDRLSQRKEII